MLNDKNTLIALRNDMNEALAAVAEKYGVKIDVGGARYDTMGLSCSYKLEVEANQTEDGTEAARAKFECYASLFGLSAEDYHNTFDYYGVEYRLVDLNLKARKKPLIVENMSNGKHYTLDAASYKKMKEIKKIMETKAA
ncbi:hypothetical protein [Mesorhizobium sp. SP-1A]|uniref:hypothetical protein n=1 Tax=Mesorhizobium sp. SP-1A TaxID=3077840 RepID=UPI0028F6D708|nr:hypothetical protein [Mesorhizobium sp. SP-1A]